MLDPEQAWWRDTQLCVLTLLTAAIIIISRIMYRWKENLFSETAKALGLNYYVGEAAEQESRKQNDMEGVPPMEVWSLLKKVKVFGNIYRTRIAGMYKGIYVSVYTQQRSARTRHYSSISKYNRGYNETIIKAYPNKPIPFELAVSKEGFSAKISKILGEQDIETYDPDFDKEVWIKSDNPDKAANFLRNGELKRAIINALNTYSNISIYNTHVCFIHGGTFIKTEYVRGVLDAIVPIVQIMSDINEKNNS